MDHILGHYSGSGVISRGVYLDGIVALTAARWSQKIGATEGNLMQESSSS